MANFILSMASIYSFKMAFVCMYADLYSRTVNIRKCALYLVAAFVPLAFVTVVSVALLNCRPLSFAWLVGCFHPVNSS